MPLNGTQLRLNLQPTPLLGKINQWRINGERELRLGVYNVRAYMLGFVLVREFATIYSKLVRWKKEFSSWLVFRLSGCKSVLSCRSCWKNVLSASSRPRFLVPTYFSTKKILHSKWLCILNDCCVKLRI